MVISDLCLSKAWFRSGGRCECNDESHSHNGKRCNKQLVLLNRGEDLRGGWKDHKIVLSDEFQTVHYEILCYDCFLKISKSDQL